MIHTYLRKTANGRGAPRVCLANAGAAAKPPPARFRLWRNRGAPRCVGRSCAPWGSGVSDAGGNAERRRAKRAAVRDLYFLPMAALGKV